MAKKKTGLFIAGGVLALVLVGGGIAGAALTGIIKIPGLTPVKQKNSLYGESNQLYGEGSELQVELKPHEEKEQDKKDNKPETTVAKKEAPKPPTKKEAPTTDPELGAKKLAQVWNGIKADKLVLIAEEYNDKELALILNKMDAKKVAGLLGELEPKRAALISKQMQALGSVLPTPPT